jgi:deoxyadenosine/deoxycytidine kinase
MSLKNGEDQRPCSQKETKVVVLVGPVGVGKTTIRRCLAFNLKKEGVRVSESYIRLNHLFAHLFLSAVTKVLHCKGYEPISALGGYNPRIFIRLFPLWKSLMVFSLVIKYLARIYFPCKVLKKTTIVEDYLPVTLCDLMWVARWFSIPLKSLSKELSILIRLLVKLPMRVVCLEASYENLIKRWLIRGSLERDKVYINGRFAYIRFHRMCAITLLKLINLDNDIIVLNTDNTNINELVKQILNDLIVGQ